MVEELGPTFVKLGQTLSTRADILPAELIKELDKLQDDVPPFPFEVAQEVIETELGAPLASLFAEVNPVPLAAASIGQVHRATMLDGTDVVLKVQRPGVEQQMEADLLLMSDLAYVAERRTDWGKIYSAEELVTQFKYQLREQLDYMTEGRHADQFRAAMGDSSDVYVPKVFWEYSTRCLLTMEYVEGIKLTQLQLIDEAGLDRRALAVHFVKAMLEQAFFKGFYHGDPHPGNLMVTPHGTIVFMDFGMVGYLDEQLKDQLLTLVIAVAQNDIDTILHTLLSIGIVRGRIDKTQAKVDLRRVLRKYYEMPLAEVPFAEAMNEMLTLATTYHVRFPPDLTLLIKTALTVEGLATQLDPGLSIVDIAKPLALRIQLERLSPKRFAREAHRELRALRRLMTGLPARIDDLLQLVESGELKLIIEVASLDDYIRWLIKTVNRVAAALIIAAIFLGSALILRSPTGPQWLGIPAFAFIGLVVSGVLGIWFFFALIRSGAL